MAHKMQYWQKRKQDRLYKQWMEHSQLPSDTVPPPEITVEVKGKTSREGWFYQFRVSIWHAVGKILRVK